MYPTMSYQQAHVQAEAQAQAHRSFHVQPDPFNFPGGGGPSMINSFPQTHVHVPAPPNTIPAVNLVQCFTHDGQIVYIPSANIVPAPPAAPTHYSPGLGCAPQATYPGCVPGYSMMPYEYPHPHPQARQGYVPGPDHREIMHKDVFVPLPGLDNRRGSHSTNESVPGTPFYGSWGHRDHGTVIRSPIFSTPSPPNPNQNHISHNLNVPQAGNLLPYKSIPINYDFDAPVVQQPPPIPHAVPAIFTPREKLRTLEQSLSNPIHGNRNVYIRGLHPDTTDKTLAAYAGRFGRVETSKLIVNTSTGACKGFGFAKYFLLRDAEKCIRGLYRLGYEVGFARESVKSRLTAKGDHSSTNIYVSNLSKSINETELAAIFADYKVISSILLRDPQGKSRGVGFARFETRDICEDIIQKFHGRSIGKEGLLLQVRYADTRSQKELKKITTERREFRATEYNLSVYGSFDDIASLAQ